MDSERKGYITVDNVLDLMGSDGTEEGVKKMFSEAQQRLSSKFDKICFEDFARLMKGQEGDSDVKLSDSPELKISPGMPPRSVSSADLHTLSQNKEKAEAEKEIQRIEETEVEIIRRSSPVKRVRSASFSEVSLTGGMTREDSASPVFHLGSAFRIARENSYELGGLEEKGTPLKESRRIYRSHRTMRIALIEASRRFEEQTKGKLVREKSDSVGSDEQSGLISATLTMWKKRNGKPLPCVHSLGSSGDEDESVNVDKQEKKERKKRIRVMSDITGFGLSLAK